MTIIVVVVIVEKKKHQNCVFITNTRPTTRFKCCDVRGIRGKKNCKRPCRYLSTQRKVPNNKISQSHKRVSLQKYLEHHNIYMCVCRTNL